MLCIKKIKMVGSCTPGKNIFSYFPLMESKTGSQPHYLQAFFSQNFRKFFYLSAKFPGMGKSYIVCLLVFLGLMFSGCHHQQVKSDNSQKSHDKALLDSIKELDSLSFATLVANNSLSQLYAAKALTVAMSLNSSEGKIIALSAKANSFPSSSPDSEFTYLMKALKISDRSEEHTS